ncbi:MAG TPA: hypothetical protein VG165_02985 [Solirubrobacteraceae bacterium]|jgi:hypothetical protein|nr:hypothetical protein [Solirubrobacteraceae bacterium]
MSRARRAASITLVVAISAGLAAQAGAATPASFTSRANKVCAAAGAKVVALPAPTATTVLPDLRANGAIITKLVSQLKAIKPPAKLAKAYAAFIASTKRQGTILSETLAAVAADQASKIPQLSAEAQTVGKRSDTQAKALKLSACAKDYSPAGTPSPTTTTTPAGAAAIATPAGASAPAAPVAPVAPSATIPAAAGTSAGGGASQSGTQTFNGSSSSGQTVNSTGGIFTT